MTDGAVGGGVDDLPVPEHPATKSSASAHSGLHDLKRTSIPNPRKLTSLTRGQIGWITSLMVAAIRLGRLPCRTRVSCRASTRLKRRDVANARVMRD